MSKTVTVPKAKTRGIDISVDADLYAQISDYAKENKVSIAALGRALLRLWTNAETNQPLPPGIDDEKRRPPRKKRAGTNGSFSLSE